MQRGAESRGHYYSVLKNAAVFSPFITSLKWMRQCGYISSPKSLKLVMPPPPSPGEDVGSLSTTFSRTEEPLQLLHKLLQNCVL